jgi:cytochrome c-type biogenesis protein CcmH/NrfG
MIYQANLLFEQAEPAYRIAARLAPNDYQWAYAQAVLEEEKGGGKEQLAFLQSTLRLNPGHLSALMKLADWFFKVDQLDEAAKYYEQASPCASATGTG